MKPRAEIISISAREASRVTGIPERTLRQQAEDGIAPARKIGRRWVFPVADLREWINNAPRGGGGSSIGEQQSVGAQ